MSLPPTLPPDDDDDALAAEYVLGLTDLAGRQAAEARAKRDPAFAARIAAWEVHFSGLNAEFAPASPPPDLMDRVEARLFPRQPARRGRWSWLRGFGPGVVVLGLVAWFLLAPAAPDLTATLTAEGAGPRWTASLSGQDLTVTPVALPGADAGQDYELWVIQGDQPPVSLGVLPADGTRVRLTASAGAILAVSLEPKGGSPTGQPTGPILALGPLQKT